MLLEIGCRDALFDVTLNCLLNNTSFSLAPGHQVHFFCPHYSTDSHCDSSSGYILLTKKVAGGIFPGNFIKGDKPCFRIRPRTRLIEPDVSGSANTQQLDIYAACLFNAGFVLLAKSGYIFFIKRSVGDMNLILRYVDMIEEMLFHKPDIALKRIGFHGIVLIKVERNNIFKTKPFILV